MSSAGPETTICWTLYNMDHAAAQVGEFLKDKTILSSEFLVQMWAVKLTIEGAHDIEQGLCAYYTHVSGDRQESLFADALEQETDNDK